MKRDATYHPISDISVIRPLIDGPLEESEQLYKDFLSAKDKPYILDRETLDRAIDVYEKERDMDYYFKEQFRRWRQEDPDQDTSVELDRLEAVRERYDTLAINIINLCKELKKGCIDRILEMDET